MAHILPSPFKQPLGVIESRPVMHRHGSSRDTIIGRSAPVGRRALFFLICYEIIKRAARVRTSLIRTYIICQYAMKSDLFQRRIEDEQTEGWKVNEDGDEKVVMMKPNYGSMGGHVLVAILTVWWTLGIGNALYAAYKYWGDSDKKVVRDEEAQVA